jgi:hypothetical protein
VRKSIGGLIRGSRPVLVMTALVAVVGISGTAYANKDDSGPSSKHAAKKHEDPHKGDKGKGGNNWDKWPKHHGGHDDDAAPEYGVATVNVSRGGAPAAVWATYSTLLGSPVGDTTGGVFRFTCSNANAPCTVSVGAAILSDASGSAQVYPRVLIYRQDFDNGGPEVYCEYGDGATGAAPLAVAKQASTSTPTYAPVPLDIGGSADCGGPDPTAGGVNQITVPAGYYDVHSTFAFLQ